MRRASNHNCGSDSDFLKQQIDHWIVQCSILDVRNLRWSTGSFVFMGLSRADKPSTDSLVGHKPERVEMRADGLANGEGIAARGPLLV